MTQTVVITTPAPTAPTARRCGAPGASVGLIARNAIQERVSVVGRCRMAGRGSPVWRGSPAGPGWQLRNAIQDRHAGHAKRGRGKARTG
jgi:hypothetical protein